MVDPRVEEHADVFGSVADPRRLEILTAILTRFMADGPVTFSEAMDATGFEDSGHFGYHLRQLMDRFVWERDGRYVPTTAAYELLPAVSTGRLLDYDFETESPTVGSCIACGQPLVARFDYDFLVQCRHCEDWSLFFQLAPAVAEDADLRTLAHELDRTTRDRAGDLIERRCDICGGETTMRFRRPREGPYAPRRLDVCVDVHCETCRRGIMAMTVGQFLLSHPTVGEYCRENGIDLGRRPRWEYSWTRTDVSTEIRSRDPWEVEKYAFVDGCRLVAVFEADGTLSHVDHVRVDGERSEGRTS